MKQEYIDLINKIKQKQQERESNKKELSENAKKLMNAMFNEPVDEQTKKDNAKKALENVLYMEEYQKEEITFGVVCARKNIRKNIDLGKLYEMYYETETVFDSYIIMIDNENAFQYIMLKRFENKEDAINYAKTLNNIIEKNDLDYIIKTIDNSI